MAVTALDDAWLAARITRTKEMIVIIEDQIDKVAAGAQTYTLDTGQTRQSVTAATLGSLRFQLDQLENRLATLDARRCGASFNSRQVT